MHGLGRDGGTLYIGDNGHLTAYLNLGFPVVGSQDMGRGQDVGFSLGSQGIQHASDQSGFIDAQKGKAGGRYHRSRCGGLYGGGGKSPGDIGEPSIDHRFQGPLQPEP